MSITLAGSYPAPAPLSWNDSLLFSHTMLALRTKYHRHRMLILPFFQDFDTQHTSTVSLSQYARVLTIVGLEVSPGALALLQQVYISEHDPSRVNYRRFLYDLEQPLEEEKDVDTILSHNSKLVPIAQPQKTDAATLQNVLHRIQTEVKQQRIHVNDLFQDFDPLSKKRITPSQFERCLNLAEFHLSREDIQLLLRSFVSAADPARIDYQAFIDSITCVFIPPHASASSPLTEPPSFVSWRVEEKVTEKTLSVHEDNEVIEMMEELAYITHTRRILIKPHFFPYDHAKHGCVTERQFLSVLSSILPVRLSPRQMDLIARKYTCGIEGVNYVAFCRDILANEKAYDLMLQSRENPGPGSVRITSAAAAASPSSPSSLAPSYFPNTIATPILTHPQLIASIRQTLREHRLDLSDCFSDFDKLNKGAVTRSRFHRCITTRGLRLTPQEIDVLANAYAAGPDGSMVNYARFVDDLSFIPKV